MMCVYSCSINIRFLRNRIQIRAARRRRIFVQLAKCGRVLRITKWRTDGQREVGRRTAHEGEASFWTATMTMTAAAAAAAAVAPVRR